MDLSKDLLKKNSGSVGKGRIIGIEIGSNTLKFAECAGGEVKNMAVAKLPENLTREGKITAPTAMTAFIKDMLKEANIKPGPCALVLPTQVVVANKVTMPLMSHDEIMLNLPFEFKDFLGKDAGKYDFDYVVLGTYENMISIYAAAVPKEIMDEYYEVLGKAGLKLKYAMPTEMAWLNLITTAEGVPEQLCIVDMGHGTTQVGIYNEGKYEMGRGIEIAGSTLDHAIAQRDKIDVFVARTRKEANMDNVLSSDACTDIYSTLALEVMRIVNFYKSSTDHGAGMNDIYYCGGCSNIESLRTLVLKATDCTMHHIRRLVKTSIENDELVLYCALAAGAAMQSGK